jgi:hypothetical protein
MMKGTRILSITFRELERAALDREKSITVELVFDGHGTGIDHLCATIGYNVFQ